MNPLEFKGKKYPHFQSVGNAAKLAIPYAKYVCKGFGYDVGCMKEEWAFPGSYPIDTDLDDIYHADHLPPQQPDYIFSSHCLEHIPYWVDTMDYWYERLKVGGVLFLYLPDYSQEYWRPWNNRRHLNIFSPTIIKDYMEDKGYGNIFHSGVDLNSSFMIYGKKMPRMPGL